MILVLLILLILLLAGGFALSHLIWILALIVIAALLVNAFR
jgi:hypothetical protein